VSHADLHPSVLWRSQETEVCLILRPKPRNRQGDFEAQITKLQLPVLRPNRETVATDFEVKLGETVATGFEANPGNRRHWF
jgi:hypothetical protein